MQTQKIITEALIAAAQNNVETYLDATESQRATLRDLMLIDRAPDYDDVLDALEVPRVDLADLCFQIASMSLTPDEMRVVSRNLAALALDILTFALNESEQPEDVIDAVHSL